MYIEIIYFEINIKVRRVSLYNMYRHILAMHSLAAASRPRQSETAKNWFVLTLISTLP